MCLDSEPVGSSSLMHVMLGTPVSDPKIILTDMDKNPDPIPIDDKNREIF